MKLITISLFVKNKRSIYRIAKTIAESLDILIGPPIGQYVGKEFIEVREVQFFPKKHSRKKIETSSIPDEADPLLMDCTHLSKNQLKERQEEIYQWFDKRLRRLEEK